MIANDRGRSPPPSYASAHVRMVRTEEEVIWDNEALELSTFANANEAIPQPDPNTELDVPSPSGSPAPSYHGRNTMPPDYDFVERPGEVYLARATSPNPQAHLSTRHQRIEEGHRDYDPSQSRGRMHVFVAVVIMIMVVIAIVFVVARAVLPKKTES